MSVGVDDLTRCEGLIVVSIACIVLRVLPAVSVLHMIGTRTAIHSAKGGSG